VEEFTSLAVFENQEADLVPLPDLVELDDVGMVLNRTKR
jgi:hypothetical protein